MRNGEAEFVPDIWVGGQWRSALEGGRREIRCPADGSLGPVQEAFRQAHGLQCGFCTPGFVVTVHAFLEDNPNPSLEEIKEGLSGNLCRCTGYQGIIKAVQIAAETMSTQDA